MHLRPEFNSRLAQVNNHQMHIPLIYLIEYTDLIEKAVSDRDFDLKIFGAELWGEKRGRRSS